MTFSPFCKEIAFAYKESRLERLGSNEKDRSTLKVKRHILLQACLPILAIFFVTIQLWKKAYKTLTYSV